MFGAVFENVFFVLGRPNGIVFESVCWNVLLHLLLYFSGIMVGIVSRRSVGGISPHSSEHSSEIEQMFLHV